MHLVLIDQDVAFRTRLRPVLKRVEGVTGLQEFDSLADLPAVTDLPADSLLIVADNMLTGDRKALVELAQSAGSLPVIVIGPDDPDRLRTVFRDGAHGFVRRLQWTEELAPAIGVVIDGGIYIPPIAGMRPPSEPLMTEAGPVPPGFFREDAAQHLTPRQKEVLAMIRSGWSNTDIADRLDVTIGTVKIHITAIFKALGVRNRTQAKIAAERLDLPAVGRPPSLAG